MERWRKALGGRTITLINAMERNTMGYKYTNTQRYKYKNTNIQIYKYNTNTLINAMESWKKQPHQCNDPRHIVEIIQRIETWIFCVFKSRCRADMAAKKDRFVQPNDPVSV